VKHRDLVARKIVSVEEEEGGVLVTYKDKKVLFVPALTLDDPSALTAGKEAKTIVTLNNEGNVAFLLKHWKEASSQPNLTIMFINPFSSGDTKWVICPHIHSKIADPSSLKLGLESMSELVDPIDEKTFLSKNF